MKTLDEVIDKLIECHTRWCRWSETSDIVDRSAVEDALFYLKEYKANQEDPDGDHQQLEKAQKLLWEFYQNDPLSWDELKGMEGKPVWIEQTFTHKKYTGWVINKGIDELALITDARSFDRATFGKTWQAYRKEHK